MEKNTYKKEPFGCIATWKFIPLSVIYCEERIKGANWILGSVNKLFGVVHIFCLSLIHWNSSFIYFNYNQSVINSE